LPVFASSNRSTETATKPTDLPSAWPIGVDEYRYAAGAVNRKNRGGLPDSLQQANPMLREERRGPGGVGQRVDLVVVGAGREVHQLVDQVG